MEDVLLGGEIEDTQLEGEMEDEGERSGERREVNEPEPRVTKSKDQEERGG